MALQATYFGANGWLFDFAGFRVLLDPWLTGPLEFPPGPWFFRAELNQPWPVPERLDLLLLTQGLPDHCHAPTLALLDPSLPVVGSASAAERARRLGFLSVTSLAPGERHQAGELTVTASAGAPVPQVENGYLLEHPKGSLYVEPHGYLSGDLPAQPLDAVVTPVLDLGLPLVGAFVKGMQVLPEVLERFQPRVVLASTTGGEVRYEGALTRILWQKGSVELAARMVESRHEPSRADSEPGPSSRLIDPVPGVSYDLMEI
ncbi:MBL fold metallo-hydrolase [Synechococcus sp. BSF8S]|uniref:MBL fold metallo-hydrolase n=1 Tax=Synechococcales TaxID=1890424 RepID=UPI001626D8EA|nr:MULTISPECIES: MBL fold metallo-hydrolase [unclassified Synechococcus]MBC1260927.1 MBL fold metallo-hydrolase [Synechococcus sp. BSF8S]MBC1263604.1 MBL fold metallo-hydrolase [Synechococcus sp. BSA11S]